MKSVVVKMRDREAGILAKFRDGTYAAGSRRIPAALS